MDDTTKAAMNEMKVTMKKPTRLIYIAGPMTGIPDINFPAFNKAARKFRDAGLSVVNPAELARGRMNGRDILPIDEINQIMSEELEILQRCDAIYLLRGWEDSKGAKRELQTAIERGLRIILESEYENR